MIYGIIGMDRGGTSATAAVVKSLGVTVYGCEHSLDDTELFGAYANRGEIIKSRAGSEWCWKYPYNPEDGVEQIPETDKYILVLRCPAARAMNSKDLNAVTPEKIRESIEWMQKLLPIYKTGKPVCYVSYEKLLTQTEEMVETIADFVGKPVTSLAKRVIDHKKGYENVKDLNKGVLK